MVAFTCAITALALSSSPGCFGRNGVTYMCPAMAAMLGPISPMSPIPLMSIPGMLLDCELCCCALPGGAASNAVPRISVRIRASWSFAKIVVFVGEVWLLGNIGQEPSRKFRIASKENLILPATLLGNL